MNIKVGIFSLYLLTIGLTPAIATDRAQLSTNLENKVERIAQTTASEFFQTGVNHYREVRSNEQ